MDNKKIVKYIGFLAAMIVLLAAPAYAPPRAPSAAHPAKIAATGTLTLKSFGGDSFDMQIDVSFLAIVPDAIPRTTHTEINFTGNAVVLGRSTKFDGRLNITDIIVWVKFDVSTDSQYLRGRYEAQGELDIDITDVTLPIGETTWAMMKGQITSFGNTKAFGALMAHAKISENNNFTKASGFFSLQPPQPDETSGTRVYTFYTITLLFVTKTELNTAGRNMYIEGNWSVYNRTTTINTQDHTETDVGITIKPVVENVTGKLSVTLPTFNLTIPALTAKLGADNINGTVFFFHFKFAKPYEHDIPMSDFNRDRLVNIQDLAQMGKAYGAKLGSPRYGFDLDVNSDFVINILDISKAGQEFGQEY
jgi:hypothetical protein